MSDSRKYMAVSFITIKCLSELESEEGGVRIFLTEEPKYNSHTTLFVGAQQPDVDQESMNKLNVAISKLIVTKLGEVMPGAEGKPVTDTLTPVNKEIN